ncbi:MAG: DEAD/DEAH box helicase family protein, partial [Chloroflexi bacterium]|nr:DEAD/DEAH box helicase family protein [Chloroflexota bacterium]
MAFTRPFRRYQSLALDAFDQQSSGGRKRAYLVLPPGAGKTVLGLEAARRLGQRTLCLCPNTAVQSQWLSQWAMFSPSNVPISTDPTLSTPFTVLTYQSLCSLDPDRSELEEHALDLWRRDLETREGLPADAADARIDHLRQVNTAQFHVELAHYCDRARALLTDGGSTEDLLSLLHHNGRAIVERARAGGPLTLVLDECHHLLELWGHLVRAVIDDLGPETFVIGLTATPPDQLTARESALYSSIFGQANFTVPTPAVVKEGDLAPYQELAYFVQPLDNEAEYVATQEERFQSFISRLLDPDFATCSLVEWLQRRVVERRTQSGATLGWSTFERDRPALAQAAIRFFHAYGLDLPEGVRLTERFQQPLAAEDWVALVEDYSIGFLRMSADPRDRQHAWDEVHAGLPSLGYTLTVRGVRSSATPVDRVLALSGSKAVATTEILRIERNVLGAVLRALVLCDFEHASSEMTSSLRGVLDPQAGSAMLVLSTLTSDPACADLNPVLVTGRTVACSRATAPKLCEWIAGQEPLFRTPLEQWLASPFSPTPSSADSAVDGPPAVTWGDPLTLSPVHPLWRPRMYVPLLTRAFEDGVVQCLVGTRALLGEGWDAQRVNVLIDLTAAGTSVAVHQMRGRSLRLDPQLPRKVADNWDVVCVAPEHPKGANDYVRFVRKHDHYFAPTIEGEIESGVSHVHHALSPFGPPDADTFHELNSTMTDRVQDRDGAYTRWAVGQPYANVQIQTVRMHFGQSIGVPALDPWRHAPAGASSSNPVRRQLMTLAGLTLAGGLLGLVVGASLSAAAVSLTLVGLVCGAALGVAVAGRSLRTTLTELQPSDTLEDLASAVAAALRATGGIESQGDVHVVLQDDGFYRCYLTGATREESALFAESMDELLAPLVSPRYIIPRAIAADPPRSSLGAVRRALRPATSDRVVYHSVPAYLAANKTRVQAFE